MAETNNAGMINALKESNKQAAGVIKDELKDQFKPFTDQLLAPLNNIKSGISALPGVGVTKKLLASVESLSNQDVASNIESAEPVESISSEI